MKPRRIDIWRDRGVYRARFIYDVDLIDFFRSLPPGERVFDHAEKTWNFDAKHLRITLQTARQFGFSDVILWPSGQAPPPRGKKKRESKTSFAPEPAGQTSDILEFFRLLPREAAHSAYRRAAAMLHPDAGGSNDKMQKLNALWERIEKAWYTQ